MKNYIRSLPCIPAESSDTLIKKKSNNCLAVNQLSPSNCAPFEFATFTNLKQATSRPCLSLSPRINTKILDLMIGELKEIETSDLRKNIIVTKKDLTNKVTDLKILTRLDADEFMEIKLKRWSQKRFINVEEREIRQIIKKDSKLTK